eukprot:340-Heterococcus_DN1.PRE.1
MFSPCIDAVNSAAAITISSISSCCSAHCYALSQPQRICLAVNTTTDAPAATTATAAQSTAVLSNVQR